MSRRKREMTFEEKIVRAVQHTWNAIASDVFSTYGEDLETDDIIELCIDADRLMTMGDLDRETHDKFMALTIDEQTKIARTAFGDFKITAI